VRAVVIIAVLALAPLAAHAGPEAEKIAEQGFAAYDRGEYATAISYFERAYEVDANPGLLFNIAQAYRKLGVPGCERALAYYRRYRDALAESGAPVHEGLHARIVEMQACVESGVARDPGGESADDRPAMGDLGAGGSPGPGDVRSTSASRRTGWIVVGGGAVAMVAAGVTGALALDRESQLSSRCANNVCPSSIAGQVRDYNRLRYAAFGSGAVAVTALAVGGYLLLRSDGSKPSELALRAGIQPVFGRDTVGVRCAF